MKHHGTMLREGELRLAGGQSNSWQPSTARQGETLSRRHLTTAWLHARAKRLACHNNKINRREQANCEHSTGKENDTPRSQSAIFAA